MINNVDGDLLIKRQPRRTCDTHCQRSSSRLAYGALGVVPLRLQSTIQLQRIVGNRAVHLGRIYLLFIPAIDAFTSPDKNIVEKRIESGWWSSIDTISHGFRNIKRQKIS